VGFIYDYATDRAMSWKRMLGYSDWALGYNELSQDRGLIHRHLVPGRNMSTFLAEAKESYDDDFLENMDRLIKEYKMYEKYGFEDPHVNYLYSYRRKPIDKIKYLKDLKEDLGPEKFKKKLGEYIALGVISDKVLGEYALKGGKK